MIGQIVFNLGGLGANRNVSEKLSMKLAIGACAFIGLNTVSLTMTFLSVFRVARSKAE